MSCHVVHVVKDDPFVQRRGHEAELQNNRDANFLENVPANCLAGMKKERKLHFYTTALM